MKIEVNRMEVLSRIENAMLAVMAAPILVQSDTIVFEGGELISFSGEILTRQPSPFGEKITGAILAGDLLEVFKRFPDDVLRVESKEGELIVRGKKRMAGLRMMEEILLPYKNVPDPGKFYSFSDKLIPHMLSASGACGKDETKPKITHVHITENIVEAVDGFQYFRASFQTGLKREVQIHHAIIKSLSKYPLKEASVSEEGWIHFKTDGGDLRISCVCNTSDYFSEEVFENMLKQDGVEVELPENMEEILSRAEIMNPSIAATGKADSRVEISLGENRLTILTEKENGWFKERKEVLYSGPEFTFCINPAFLHTMISKNLKMIVNDQIARIERDDIHFISALIRNKNPKWESQEAKDIEESVEE